jgi:hypothetical protein
MKAAMFLCVALCLLLVPATTCAAQTAGTGSISGVVRDAGTGAPVAEASVSLPINNRGEVAVSQTDAQGQYALTGIPVGTYRGNASARPQGDPAMTPKQDKTVTLKMGQKLTSTDFRISSLGIISGRVLV